MNRSIAHRIHPTTLANLIGGQCMHRPSIAGQKLNGNNRLKRRRHGVCDTITPMGVKVALDAKGIRIQAQTAKGIFARIMAGEKVAYRGVKIHADKRRNNLFAYRI